MSTRAAFPATIRYFADKRDSTDTTSALDINLLQAEVTAIEQTLGLGVTGGYRSVAERLDQIVAGAGGASGGVTTLNTMRGDLNVVAGANVTLDVDTIAGTLTLSVAGIPWADVTGTPAEYPPASGSGHYIWNQTAVHQMGAFTLEGTSALFGQLQLTETSGTPAGALLSLAGTAATGALDHAGAAFGSAYYGAARAGLPVLHPISQGDAEPTQDGSLWYDGDVARTYRREAGQKLDFATALPATQVALLTATTGQRSYGLPTAAAGVNFTRLYRDGLRYCPGADYTLGVDNMTLTFTTDVSDADLPMTGDRLWCEYSEPAA